MKIKGYDLDINQLYVNEDGYVFMVTQYGDIMAWTYLDEYIKGEEPTRRDANFIINEGGEIRKVTLGEPIKKVREPEIGKWYLFSNGGLIHFGKLKEIKRNVDGFTSLYVTEDGDEWRVISKVDADSLGGFV